MKLLQERFNVFISVLITVLVFALIISNFPIAGENAPIQSPVVQNDSQTEGQFESQTQSPIMEDDTQVQNPIADTSVHNGQD